jgi:hypothetical protein
MPLDPDQLRDFARRYTAAWCSQQPTRVAAHYAADGMITVNGAAPAPILEVAASFMAAFPDMVISMDDVTTGASNSTGRSMARTRVRAGRATTFA